MSWFLGQTERFAFQLWRAALLMAAPREILHFAWRAATLRMTPRLRREKLFGAGINQPQTVRLQDALDLAAGVD